MIRHLVAPNHPLPCVESLRWQASRAIYAMNRTIFHRNLFAPDSQARKANIRISVAMIDRGCFIDHFQRVVEKMESSSKGSDMNVAGSSIREAQESTVTMAASSRKTRTGRVVQCAAVAVQAPDEIAATSNTVSQRISTDYTVAVTSAPGLARETASTERPDKFEAMDCEYKSDEAFRAMVNKSIENLKTGWQSRKPGALRVCQDILSEMCFMKGKYKLGTVGNDDYQFMECQFSPYYESNLRAALEELKNKIDAGYGMEYYKLLDSMIKHPGLQSDKCPDKSANEELLRDIYRQLLHKEVQYLHHIKQDPSLWKAATNSCYIINTLLHKEPYIFDCKLMNEDDRKKILEEKNQAMTIMRLGNIDENVEKSEKKTRCDTDDEWAERKHHDLLRIQLTELKKATSNEKNSVQDCVRILHELCELRNTCIEFFEESRSLCKEAMAAISGMARKILRDSMDNIVLLDQEVMDLIGVLRARDLLGEECKKLYLVGKEFQAAMRAVIQTGSTGTITGDQCMQRITEIHSLLGNKTDADLLAAAEMLRQLLFGHWHEIKSLDMADECMKSIEEIKDTLSKELFAPVIEKFSGHEAEEKDHKQYGREMSKQRSRFVQLSSYLFVVSDKRAKQKWRRSIDVAWGCDLERLTRAKSFMEKDVDCLLELKRTAPDVPNQHIMLLLKKNLINFFSSDMLTVKGSNGELPVENVATISRWVDDLLYLKGSNSKNQNAYDMQLKELNDAWKCANKDTIPGAVSDQPVSNATLIQLESEELSTSRSTTSSAPMAEASAAEQVSETGVFPESRTDSRRDQSLVPDFSEAAEQLALATIGIGTATERASQASSPLQNADQLLFNIQD